MAAMVITLEPELKLIFISSLSSISIFSEAETMSPFSLKFTVWPGCIFESMARRYSMGSSMRMLYLFKGKMGEFGLIFSHSPLQEKSL